VQASGVERTPVLVLHDGREQAVEVRFEDGLQAAQDEIAARGGVDVEAEMQGNEQLREGVAIDAGVDGSESDESVGIRVHEAEQRAPGVVSVFQVAGARNPDRFEDGDPCSAIAVPGANRETLAPQPVRDPAGL
jgi:hypothetical protein